MIFLDSSAQQGLQITMLANTIAVALAKNLTPNEINILGNFITLIGTALTTIAAIEQSASGNCMSVTATGSTATNNNQKNSGKTDKCNA